MYSRLISWSRGVYLAGIVLALVLVIPTAWFPFQLAKVAVFAVLLAVCVALFIAGGGLREVLRAHGFKGALLAALIPLAYLLSWALSGDKSVGVVGFGVETDTVLFASLLFLTFVFSFTFFRTLRTVRLMLTVVFWALVIAAMFQFVSIVFGPSVIPFETFADRSANLIGKWNDLGILVGLLVTMLVVRLELQNLTAAARLVVSAGCVVLAVLLGIINFGLVWGFVLASCVIIGVVKLLIQRGEFSEGASFAHKVPWFAAAGAIVSVLFLFYGTALNLRLTSFFPVSSLEVRPSYTSTMGIINDSHASSFKRVLVGTGPNTFGQEWLIHKPTEVNQSAFWNLDFNVGFSTFITALGSVGLVGAIAWLIPMFLVLVGLVRALRLGVLNREDRIITTTLSIASLFLLFSAVFYVPSQNIILLSFVLAGATFGFLWRQGQSSVHLDDESPAARGLVVLVALVLLSLSVWAGLASAKRLIAQAYVGHGAQRFSVGDADGALGSVARSFVADTTGDGLRLRVQASVLKLQQIASASASPTQTVQQQFAEIVQSAIDAGQKARDLNPNDYRPAIALAQLYDYLASLNVQGAAQTAALTYEKAAEKNPSSPMIPLALARLSARENNIQKTSDYLTKSLTLKPNYTDAILLVVQLNVAQNDIPNAIRAATAAAQTAPGVAPIWFELGLLYYAAGDATKAAAALEQAVAIENSYANAKYFLGLSYHILGRTPEAIKQFQDLRVSNPNNTEVAFILGNLTSGKAPFDGAQPPVTSNPETRITAPIAQ